MNFRVRLVAEGIQVTAASAEEAIGYASADAREFIACWNYSIADVTESSVDVTGPNGRIGDFTLTCTNEPNDGSMLWSFSAAIDVDVSVGSREVAGEIAQDCLRSFNSSADRRQSAPAPSSMFVNHYCCPDCDRAWSDTWSAQCDDDCPECGSRHIEPFHSDDFGLEDVAAKDRKLVDLRASRLRCSK